MAVAQGACSSLLSSRSVLPPVRRLTSSTTSWQFSPVRLPGTTASSSLLSASTAVWSQASPQPAGSPGSRWASFLATKDHFSSSWTSRVAGGKSHQLVVEVVGVAAGLAQVAGDGVLVDFDQAAGGPGAGALADVLQDADGLVQGKPGVFQRGAFALGEGAFAAAAVGHADALAPARPTAEIQVALAAFAPVRAVGILAAEVLDGVPL